MGKSKKPGEWSLTGAARAAREARIASARFLSAPVMTEWHANRLISSFETHRAHHGDPGTATGVLFGGLGYLPPYPVNWVEASNLVLGDETRYLSAADLYVLSPEMLNVVVAAALTLTVDDLALIAEDDLPSPSGLIVLPRPLICRAVNGELGDPRAYLWHSPARIITQITGSGPTVKPAVHITVYNDGHGPVRPQPWVEFTERAAAAGTPVPPLFLDATRCVPYSRPVTRAMAEDLRRFSEGTRQRGQAIRAQAGQDGPDEEKVIGEYTPGTEIDDADDLFGLRFLYAFWRLAEQRIATAEEAPVNHSARVTAERAGVPATVRVVRLRRTGNPSAETAGKNIRYRHRWTVRMHKVRQWYPSEHTHKIIYRGPYVKGPDGAPMIDGETTWALVR